MSCTSATECSALAAAAGTAMPVAAFLVMPVTNMGTKMATPNGAVISRNTLYVPEAEEDSAGATPDRATFMKMVPLPPMPRPTKNRAPPIMRMPAFSPMKSMIREPMATNTSAMAATTFGSFLSAMGPRTTVPMAMPRYSMLMATAATVALSMA